MIHFKLYFLKSDDVNDVDFIKRVNSPSPPSWKGFHKILESLFPSHNYSFSIKWKDEEGDVILMDTQQEWEEAISCSPSPVKLYVKTAEVEAKAEKEEVEEEEEEPAFSLTPEYFYSEAGEELSRDEKVHLTNTIPDIMSRLVSPSGDLPRWLMEAISATSSSGDILLDVNVPQFAYALHSRALHLLTRADDADEEIALSLNTQAMRLLRECVLLTPGDRIVNFNLACALSKINEIDEAFAPLEMYVSTGEAKNIFGDPDLDNVRKSARFAEWSKRFLNVEEKEEVVIEDVDKVDDIVEEFEKLEFPEESAPEPAPEPAPEKWAKELETLKELGIEEEIARVLLDDFEGDLDGIMNAQFQSQFF